MLKKTFLLFLCAAILAVCLSSCTGTADNGDVPSEPFPWTGAAGKPYAIITVRGYSDVVWPIPNHSGEKTVECCGCGCRVVYFNGTDDSKREDDLNSVWYGGLSDTVLFPFAEAKELYKTSDPTEGVTILVLLDTMVIDNRRFYYPTIGDDGRAEYLEFTDEGLDFLGKDPYDTVSFNVLQNYDYYINTLKNGGSEAAWVKEMYPRPLSEGMTVAEVSDYLASIRSAAEALSRGNYQ